MNPRLTTFLEADDLDVALNALRDVGKLSDDDWAYIEQIFADWSPPQAVANLLIHAIVPTEKRLDILFKALHETENPYFALAATVGFQNVNAEKATEEERKCIVDELFGVMERYPPVAARATQSIRPFLTRNDAPKMLQMLGMLEGTGRHNALAWLLTDVADKDSDALPRLIADTDISPEVAQFALGKLEEYDASKTDGGFCNLGFPLLSYIPNLKDMIQR